VAGSTGGKTATSPASSPAQAAAPGTETTASASTEVNRSGVVRLSGPAPENGTPPAGPSAAPNGSAPGQGVVAAGLPGTAGTSAAPASPVGDRVEPGAEVGGPAGVERTGIDERAEAGDGGEALRPEVSGCLLAPPATDTRVLDLALQQLLDQIDHLGAQLKDPATWRGAGTWLAAGLVVLAGAEVQRRRRAADGVAFPEGAGLGWEGPEAGDEPDA
jgi:hypothetical protein